jgi:hypothetical protein
LQGKHAPGDDHAPTKAGNESLINAVESGSGVGKTWLTNGFSRTLNAPQPLYRFVGSLLFRILNQY